jgi:hypothetical protein
MKQELQQTVELTQEQRQRLEVLLANYIALETDIDVLVEQQDAEKAKIFTLLDENGIEESVLAEGRTCKIIRGESSSLDKLAFVALGGNLETLALATKRKPKKAYVDIRVPGKKKRGDPEEE